MKSLLLSLSFFMSITLSFSQKQVEIDGFVLAAPSSDVLTIKMPKNYEGELDFDVLLNIKVWTKKMWDKNLKDGSGYPNYTKGENYRRGKEERIDTLKVIPGEFIFSIEIKNRVTGAFVVHHKILNTRDSKSGEIQDDGFSIKFTPDSVTNGISQNKVSIGKITLEETKPGWLELSGPTYDKYMIIEIWKEKNWLIYSKRKKHEKYRNTIYRQAGYCNKGHHIRVGKSVDPGKYVLRVVFDYKDKMKKQDYAKVLDTRKTVANDEKE